ncbi:MAG: helix-turn-helix domain-containing protein [Frankia sp.]|nr:helix-turn-helix domain-containing protein [Frankia sp.]
MPTSNPTRRLVGVLDVLIRQPRRSFGLTELAKAAGISKGTCFAIAETLVEHGYLVQNAKTRAYRLGPALITAGQAVLGGFVDLRPALGLLTRFSAEFDVTCSVLAVDDDQLVVLERVGNPDPIFGLSQVGARLPFAPPWGAPFVAWWPDSELEAWFGRALSPLSSEQTSALRHALRAGRRLGYIVTRELPPGSPAAEDLHRLRATAGRVDLASLRRLADARLAGAGYYVEDLHPDETYRVNHVAVPVLGAHGEVVVSLLAMLFGRTLTAAALERLGTRMTELARAVAALVARPIAPPSPAAVDATR